MLRAVSFIKLGRKICERNLIAAKCAESRWGRGDGQLRSGLQPIRGQVMWTTDQSDACKLQAETVKITAVNTQAGWTLRPGPRLVCKYCCRFGFYPGSQARWHPARTVYRRSLTNNQLRQTYSAIIYTNRRPGPLNMNTVCIVSVKTHH